MKYAWGLGFGTLALVGCTSVGPSLDLSAGGSKTNSPATESIGLTLDDPGVVRTVVETYDDEGKLVTTTETKPVGTIKTNYYGQGAKNPVISVQDPGGEQRTFAAGPVSSLSATGLHAMSNADVTLKGFKLTVDKGAIKIEASEAIVSQSAPLAAAEGAVSAQWAGWARLTESEKEARLKEAGVAESAIPGVLNILNSLVGKF